MKNYNVEISAPVGSFESMVAAAQAGCNSIYFGVSDFNLRSNSSYNFHLKDLKKISSFCKKNNIQSYLTLNSILYDNEIKKVKNIIYKAIDEQIDGIIVSDQSLLNFLKTLPVKTHLSTQLNISNFETIKFYSEFADVIVLARELSLAQISYISKQIDKNNLLGKSGEKIKLEVFVHGALCMSISGKCFLSEHVHSSSANRGKCLQNCRRQYTIYDDLNNSYVLENSYILSAKDLCTISILDRIIKTNVKILKIEGRGRSPEYVKTVVSAYRDAINFINNNEFNENNIKFLMEKLEQVYNRGYWTGHYLSENITNWNTDVSGSKSKMVKEYIGDFVNYYKKSKIAEFVVKSGMIESGDSVLIIGPKTGVIELQIDEIMVDGNFSDIVNKNQHFTFKCNSFLRSTDKIYKVVKRN